MKVKAILIDVKTRTVSAVETEDTVEAYHKLLGCDCYTGGPRLPNRDGILVDDEGLLTMNEDSLFFTFGDYPQPLVGNGLLLGCSPSGATRNVKSSVDDIRKMVNFLTMSEVQAGAALGKWS